MTTPSEDLLTTEGVDEGSARSTVEGEQHRAATDPVTTGGPEDTEAEPAPPVGLDSPEPAGPGQQLAAGEG